MKIVFHLEFLKPSKKIAASFKSAAALELVSEYVERVNRYMPTEIAPSLENNVKMMAPGDCLWLCDRSRGSIQRSSEEIAQDLKKVVDGSVKTLRIVIGGSNGFSSEFLKSVQPKLRWSFGTLTLPHELASVVAAEQIYRAWSILRNEPYHCGH